MVPTTPRQLGVGLMIGRRMRLNLRKAEIAALNEEPWRSTYPPILSVSQACAMLGVAQSTFYEWIAKGRLDGTFRRRDRLIDKIFNGPEWSD